ncbi:LytTR family DNA-binding domain-containing protein [Absicoccus porci]|nr:LytTR family DNA-binding domain-containing protein [Absicoccus porci]
MKAEIKIENCPEPYAIIYTPEINKEVQRILSYMQQNTQTLIGQKEDRQYVLFINEIVFVQVKEEKTYVYTMNQMYRSKKRLYELKQILGHDFVQISKSSIVRMQACESVEVDFGGALVLHVKNGLKTYVSRHYLKEFKKQIGL